MNPLTPGDSDTAAQLYWWFGLNGNARRCPAYSSLTTGLYYRQPCFKRRAAGMTEVKGLQPLGVRDCCCLPAIKNPGTLLRDDLGERFPQVLAKQRPRIPSGWGAGQHLHA